MGNTASAGAGSDVLVCGVKGAADRSLNLELDKEPDQGNRQQLLQPKQREIGDEQPAQLPDTSLDRIDGHASQLDRVDGTEEGEIAEVYVELPLVAGNLSPRMIVRQEDIAEPSVQALNIDTVTNGVQGIRKGQGKCVRARFPSDRQLRSATPTYNSFQVLPYD